MSDTPTMKPRVGRPPLPPEKRHSVVVAVCYTRAEFADLCQRARRQGTPVRTFIRAITAERKGPLPGI